MRKAIQVMFGTYVASRSIMLERSSLLANIEALYINSPVPPVIAEENAQQPCRDVIAEENAQKPRPFLHTFLL